MLQLKDIGSGKNSNSYELWGLLVRVQKLISKARNVELLKCRITAKQSHILHILYDNGGTSTLNELANISLVHHNAVSTLIIRMEKLQMVTREKSSDSKQYCVKITDKGRAIFEKIPKISVEMVFADLTETEKQQFFNCLQKLEVKSLNMLGLDYKPPFVD